MRSTSWSNTVTNAENEVTTVKYNQRFQTTEVKDAINQTYTFNYDPLGRLLGQTRAGGTMSFDYDNVGNHKKRTDYMGRVTNYTYDNLNRLTKIEYEPGTGNAIDKPQSTYAYDDISRLTSAVNDVGTVAFTYDNRNRLKTETDVFGQVLEFGYDAASNRTQLKLNGSVHTSYAYDDANRLTTLTDEASQNFGFGYDSADRMTSRTMPNGITSTFEYDNMSRLKRLKHQSTSATLVDNQYTYNTASQISQIAELTQTKNFTYDNVDRLTGMTNGTTTESYTYDDVGNRTASHLSASYGYQTGQFNQLTSTATGDYQFDANGNTVRKSEGQNFWRYTWDYENRLTEASTRKKKARYKYDALGRRVERNLRFSKERTRFTHDGLDVVMDSDAETGITKYQNGLSLDDKLKLTNSGNPSYFLQDNLGSTVGLSNASASVTSSANYDSFGNTTGNLASRYQFTGREFDSFSGLQFSRARFYDAKLGRFISEDPIGFKGGDVNLYGYVWDSPMAFTDPMGLDGWGNDLADFLDDNIERARRFYQRDPQNWRWNATVNTNADILSGCADMFRVGNGIGYAMYAPDENGWGRAAFIAQDVARAAGLFSTMAGPFAGRFNGRGVGEPGNHFPANPDDLLPSLPRDAKGNIQTSDYMRIRPEQHAMKPGETFNPRHHGQHYHVEIRPTAQTGWHNKSVVKVKPPGYQPGSGTGFLPGESFP